MHQGIGLDAFNALPARKAVHALYECCNSYALAADLCRGRAYPDHDALYRRLDTLLFALPEDAIDQILDACPDIGRRPRSTRSQAEHCSVWDDDPELMNELRSASHRYAQRYGFAFVMYVDGHCANEVLAAVTNRMHHDVEMERKILRNELAKIGRSRVERMLGPEGGFHNW
ncbi:2-oxo-4-hydroxy-4-carboxy-5-ureidoimidazoline decarboxylase [Mycobacterium sp. NPDC003323]